MTDLRKLCRCGHVRNSHTEGIGDCFKNPGCPCTTWTGAYPVFNDRLPDGVTVLNDLSTGLSIVACHHTQDRAKPWCPFCFAEARMTAGFTVPVKRLVFAPMELTLL